MRIRLGLFAIGMGVLLAAGCSAGDTSASMPAPTPSASIQEPRRITVPDVIGLDGVEAATALRSAGLESDPRWRGLRTVDSDLFDVISQDPAPGAEAAELSVVTLEVGPPPLPPHNTEERSPTLIAVQVDRSITAREAHWLVRGVADAVTRDDGFFVVINCSTGGTDVSDNRLANGRFASGERGATILGMEIGQSEVEVVDGASCP